MATPSNRDTNLTIQLLSFDRPSERSERFYFLEMSTLQATTLLPPDIKVSSCNIFAYTQDGKYLDVETVAAFKTISNLNVFFSNNPDFYIHNCSIEFQNGLTIHSHDDGEVSIQFDNIDSERFVHRIFESFNLDKTLISLLMSKPGHYIAIDSESNVTAIYETFDEYVKTELN